MQQAADLEKYTRAISHSGHRLTRQRRKVFDVLHARRDHPTATEVFVRVKNDLPSISLATVYNCLETLVDCGMVRQVHFDREPTRYCANLQEHGHFVCGTCGGVFDVTPSADRRKSPPWNLPTGFVVTSQELTLRGTCATCMKSKPFINP